MALNKFNRSPHSPSPIYGIRPGFNISDLDAQYTSAVPAITSVTGTTTSSALDIGARAISLHPLFVGAGAKADILVYSADDSYVTPIATFLAVTNGSGALYVGGSASKSGDSVNGTYQATQYGPVPPQSEATSGLSEATDHNYVGGSYNPALYLSLDGKPIKVKVDNVTGTVSVTVTPNS